MKRFIAILLLMALWWVAPVQAGTVQGEEIRSFESRLVLQPDGWLEVTESIQVFANGSKIKHGIDRDFPQFYRGKWGLRSKPGFEVVGVSRDGNAEPWRLRTTDSGPELVIGDPSATLPTGTHTYELRYRVAGQIAFRSPKNDELRWPITGSHWQFPILSASATISLPPGVEIASSRAEAGPMGVGGHACESEFADGGAFCKTAQTLSSGEGLTMHVTWPKGHFVPPRFVWRRFVAANPGFSFGVAGLGLLVVYYLIAWSLVGRDPPRGTIIPQYGPPPDISPAVAGYLWRLGDDMADKLLTAGIMSLAANGLITIEQGQNTFTLKKTGADASNLPLDESALFKSLFRMGDSLQIDRQNRSRLQAASEAQHRVLQRTVEDSLFARHSSWMVFGLLLSCLPVCSAVLLDPEAIAVFPFALPYLCFGVCILTLTTTMLFHTKDKFKAASLVWITLAAMWILAAPVFIIGSEHLIQIKPIVWCPVLFLMALAILLNSVALPSLLALTRLGRSLLDQIEGFRLYLNTAEADRLNLENPPERTPQLFERYLPYALALDVKQTWSENFADVVVRSEFGNVVERDSGDSADRLGRTSEITDALQSSITDAKVGSDSGSVGDGGGSSEGGGGGW